MFLRIATVLAILGLLLSLLLSLTQQSLIMTRYYYPYVFRLLSVAESLSIVVPLIIFFVAFFFSLKTKPS